MYLFIFKKAYFDFIKVPLQAEVRVCFGEFFFVFVFVFLLSLHSALHLHQSRPRLKEKSLNFQNKSQVIW